MRRRLIIIGGALSPPTQDGHEALVRGIIDQRARAGKMDENTEIVLLPSADGQPVLGKEITAVAKHRLAMVGHMVTKINHPLLAASDLEIALAEIIELPSYTANTLIVLREGLNGLLKRPLNLLTPKEKELSEDDQADLILQRIEKIQQYLESLTHPWLTPDGILPNEDDEIIAVYGADSLKSFSGWYDVDTLIQYVNELYFLPRADIRLEEQQATLIEQKPAAAGKIIVFTETPKELSAEASSTQLRNAFLSQHIALGTLAGKALPNGTEARDIISRSLQPENRAYIETHGLYKPLVQFVTDPEGNWTQYDQSLQRADALTEELKQDGLVDSFLKMRVCGGDLPNKGTHDLRITRDIQQRVEKGEKWMLISGNRDDNSIRFLELLNEQYIQQFLTAPAAFWLPESKKKTPLQFCEEKQTNYDALDIQHKRVVVLQWMLECTMGAPAAFDNRRIELSEIMSGAQSVTDVMVMQSFLDEILKPQEASALGMTQVLPEEYCGIRRWYLEQSQSLAVINQTLYSHAGLPAGVSPYLRSGSIVEGDFYAWASAYNQERQHILKEYIQKALSGNIIGIQELPAVLSSLPRDRDTVGRQYQLQSFNSLEDLHDDELLKRHNIHRSLHGHQMVLTGTPLFCRETDDFTKVGADTRLETHEQVPNGLVVAPNGDVHCVASEKGKKYYLSTTDRYIGQSVTYQGHQYLVAGKKRDTQNNYLLICRERKEGAEFMCVDKEYGVLTITLDVLEGIIRRPKTSCGSSLYGRPNKRTAEAEAEAEAEASYRKNKKSRPR
ncbi:MAG: hypothetical protein KBD83_01240 [Gammaproteobacteria bacterium]|nr:hypothetical protein [Gammaproteobacteria bacterium]